MHPRGLSVEGSLNACLKVRTERDAETARDGGVRHEAVAGWRVVCVDGGVESGGQSIPMRHVEEEKVGFGDGLAWKPCCLAESEGSLDGDHPLCVGSEDSGAEIVREGGGGRSHDGKRWYGMGVRRDWLGGGRPG